jgi:basic membrane protein A and related proteins
VVKPVAWKLLIMLGLFMSMSVFFTSSIAFTQNSESQQPEVVATTNVATPSPPTGQQRLEKKVIGLRLGKGTWSDPYNNALWQGVANALHDLPLSQGAFDIVLYDEASPLSKDVDLVLTAQSDVVAQLETDAKNHPDTQFVALDTPPSSTTLNNFHTIDFEEYEVSYLMGYLAGILSQTGHIGFVGDTATAGIASQAAFSQGLLAACSECNLHSVLVGKNDPAAATTAAQSIQQKGADIFFADAGAGSLGVIKYVNATMCSSVVKTRSSPLTGALTMVAKDINYLSHCAGSYPLFFMGTGHFQPVFGDTDNDPTSLNHGLTSIAEHIDLAVYQIIQNFIAGDAPSSSLLTLEDKAIDIAVDDYNRALLPDEVLSQLGTIKAQIISGDIVVDKVLKE